MGQAVFRAFTLRRSSIFWLFSRSFVASSTSQRLYYFTSFHNNFVFNLHPAHSIKPIMTTVWDEAAHLCLLQAVFHNVTFTSEEWQRILQFTKERGYNYTSGAAVYFSPRTFLSSSSSHLPQLHPASFFIQLSFHLIFPPITIPTCYA